MKGLKCLGTTVTAALVLGLLAAVLITLWNIGYMKYALEKCPTRGEQDADVGRFSRSLTKGLC